MVGMGSAPVSLSLINMACPVSNCQKKCNFQSNKCAQIMQEGHYLNAARIEVILALW